MSTTLASSAFVCTPNSVNVTWPAVSGFYTYDIVYTVGTKTITYAKKTRALNAFVTNLTPSTAYTFKIYTSDNGTLKYTGTVTTPAAAPSAFSKTAFQNSSSVFDIRALSSTQATAASSTVSNIINTAFATGDAVLVNATAQSKIVPTKATVANVSATVNTPKKGALYIPFEPTQTGAQSVTIHTSTNTNVPISYNSTSNSVVVNGQTYAVGAKFLLDGQYVTVKQG